MSRIYEAMKKAGLDQVGTQTKEFEPILLENLRQPSPEKISVAAEIETSAAGPTDTALQQPTLFSYADLEARCAHPAWDPDARFNVFLNRQLAFGAEQFRTLRSKLYQCRSNQLLRTILVTSSLAGEGKTFIANNLAQSLVRQPDCRTLLIDADLRCSKLHLMVGAPCTSGLSDYLTGSVDEWAVIQTEPGSNLCFIPGGSSVSNPSELLANGRLRSLLDRISPVFDWVIIDSPPHLPLADAGILADSCDGVLLVARAGVTPAQVAQRASQELKSRKVVLGVVLNAGEEISDAYDLYGKGRYAEQVQKDALEDTSTRSGGSGLFGFARRKKKDG